MAIATACGGDNAAGTPPNAGGAEVVQHGPLDCDAARIVSSELLRVGTADGDPHTVFGRITGLALEPNGRLYVADGQSAQLRIFTPVGAHVSTVGTRGSGPGEFRDIRGVRRAADGTIWIMDQGNQRYTALSRSGELLGTYSRRVPAFGTRWDGFFDAEGGLYDVATVPSDEGSAQLLIRHRMEGDMWVPADTFPLPADDEDAYYVQAPMGTLYLPVPYTPRPSWAFDGDDGLWTGAGREFRISRQSLRGDTALVIDVRQPAQRVTAAERQAAETDLRATLDRLGGSIRLDFSRIPGQHPGHGRILVDGHRNVWVARAAPADVTTFDVFSPGGAYRGCAMLELRVHGPIAFAGELLAATALGTDDVPQVVLYEIRFMQD